MRSLFVCSLAGVLLAAAPVAFAQGAKQEREAAAPTDELNEVGKGQKLARQPLKPGAFITPRHRAAVQAWIAQNHGAGMTCFPGMVKRGQACVPGPEAGSWQMGAPVTPSARLAEPPAGLLAALPPAPPGNIYVLLSGDILLIAAASRIVVDAVSANK